MNLHTETRKRERFSVAKQWHFLGEEVGTYLSTYDIYLEVEDEGQVERIIIFRPRENDHKHAVFV